MRKYINAPKNKIMQDMLLKYQKSKDLKLLKMEKYIYSFIMK